MMNRLLVWLLRGYQLLVSPMFGPSCRFYPSCSNYAIEALKLHGAARGSWLAVRRVCRCHPWTAGGLDPVPGSVSGDQPSPPTACGCNHS
jgi:putative membrane protein insertion efficiency factor